jgi:maleate isomerase
MTEIVVETICVKEPFEQLGPMGRVGLIALATDLCSEADLHSMFPTGVELYTNRVQNANPTTLENLRKMAPDIGRAARGIVPDVDLDVMIYGCTSGTVAIGEMEVFQSMKNARGDYPCTTPITAAMAAFETLGAKKISILTPYIRSVNLEVAEYFVGRGLDIVNIAGFELSSDAEMTAVSNESIYRAAIEVCHAQSDLLFISCTALRAAQLVHRLEKALNKPVVTSNQALVWHALELIGKPYSVVGFGTLFSSTTGRAA